MRLFLTIFLLTLLIGACAEEPQRVDVTVNDRTPEILEQNNDLMRTVLDRVPIDAGSMAMKFAVLSIGGILALVSLFGFGIYKYLDNGGIIATRDSLTPLNQPQIGYDPDIQVLVLPPKRAKTTSIVSREKE